MRRFTKGWFLPAVILAGCLATGCGSTASSAIGTLSSKAATISATPPAGAADATSPAATTPAVTSTATETATETATATATATSTATVTATATPTSPAASPTTASTGSGSSLLWLWILLGVAALAGLIGWIVHASRRRSATEADWQSRLIDVYAKGSALHDAMSVAEAPGQYGAPDAGGRWADIQRRADDLTQELYTLREAVPDDGDSARIADTLASLQAARSAMDAERAPGGAGPRQAEVVRGRLDSFEMSLRALRSGNADYR
jgi:outer membrane murein-binding lipoprotein Lpp